MLLVRLTELLSLKRLGIHLPLTMSPRSILALRTRAISVISPVGARGNLDSALIRRLFKHPISRFRVLVMQMWHIPFEP